MTNPCPLAWEVMTSYAQGLGVRFAALPGRGKAPVLVDQDDGLLLLREDLQGRAVRLLEAATGTHAPVEDTALWSCALIGALTEIVAERTGAHLDTRARAAVLAARGLTGPARNRVIRQFLAGRPEITVPLTRADAASLSFDTVNVATTSSPTSPRSIRIATSVGEVAAFPDRSTRTPERRPSVMEGASR